MKKSSTIYFVLAVLLVAFLIQLALPFFKNLLPGLKLCYSIFPVLFLLFTHYSPKEVFSAFGLARENATASRKEFQRAFLIFKTMQQILVALMILAIPVLVIWLLAGPKQEPAQIAHLVAIIIGAFFYPMLFILFICLPFKSALQKKLLEL